MKTDSSWVIVEKSTGKVILETFSKRLVECLNTEKYSAIPILDYLQQLNRKIKNEKFMKDTLRNEYNKTLS